MECSTHVRRIGMDALVGSIAVSVLVAGSNGGIVH